MSNGGSNDFDPSIDERSIASVGEDGASAENNLVAIRGMVVAFVIAVGGVLIYSTWDSEGSKQIKEVRKPGSVDVTMPFQPARLRVPEVVVPQTSQPSPQAAPIEDKPITPAIQEPINELLEASRRAPVLAFSSRTRKQSTNPEITALSQSPDLTQLGLLGQTDLGGNNATDKLATKLKATKLEGIRATRLTNLHMTIPKGTQIPCTLETAISSDQPGFVSCIISRDVMGASGQIVLMEKGSTILGEYEGSLKRGSKRIFVLWTEARTPTGVVVQLDSPATDALGRSGFTGRIDKKFWERFGGAFLVSIVSDASAFAFERLSRETGTEFNSSSEAPSDAAAIAVEESINLKPTLYMNHGEAMNVFVARNLDFSGVYELERIESLTKILDRTIDQDGYLEPVMTK